jgi:alpha-D-xyloside xylohydrolase
MEDLYEFQQEKGLYATVEFKWNDKTRTLTIGTRKGSFPGMAQQRTFNIILVGQNHGCGEKPTEKSDRTVYYNGKQLALKL